MKSCREFLQEDVSLRGYRKHKQVAGAPAPLTFAEEELQKIKKEEVLSLSLPLSISQSSITHI